MAEKHFVVIGLGSFGTALARRLCQNNCRVTGIDVDKEAVELLKDVLYEAAIADATQRDALLELRLQDASAVFISLGENISRSLLATLHAKELGARRIIVKGVTKEHGKILRSLGVERVIFPEIEIAEELADRMTWPNILDYLPIDPEYGFFEIAAPDSFVGKTLSGLDLRAKYGIWVVGIKDVVTDRLQMLPGADFTFGVDQMLLVIGKKNTLSEIPEFR